MGIFTQASPEGRVKAVPFLVKGREVPLNKLSHGASGALAVTEETGSAGGAAFAEVPVQQGFRSLLAGFGVTLLCSRGEARTLGFEERTEAATAFADDPELASDEENRPEINRSEDWGGGIEGWDGGSEDCGDRIGG